MRENRDMHKARAHTAPALLHHLSTAFSTMFCALARQPRKNGGFGSHLGCSLLIKIEINWNFRLLGDRRVQL
jgi:hypothetical protein